MSVFVFSAISQILETTFYVFWTQTCETFLKYHMPLGLILYEMPLSNLIYCLKFHSNTYELDFLIVKYSAELCF